MFITGIKSYLLPKFRCPAYFLSNRTNSITVDTPPLCLGCYCPVENTLCSRCGWPVCGAECQTSPQHAAECEVFAKARVRFQPVDDWTASSPQLDCITPLR